MFRMDYHTHTCCSPDSSAALSDMVHAAARAGLQELCTTDHCDLQQEDGAPLKHWDWSPVLTQFHQASSLAPQAGVHLLLGLELGGAHTNPTLAGEILEGAPLDFVIGSVHNLSPAAGGTDFFFLDYPEEVDARRALDDYMSCLMALAPLPYYDSLGHILYPLRYINGRAHYRISLDLWKEQLDTILRTVIQSGRAIEINTHTGREIAPWRPILKRYRQLGGELITIGSDAHRPQDVGRGLSAALELLRETGFRWLTRYRQRKPDPILF